ncbi:cd63 antigen [Rhizophlyctis rosea]|uniref:Cd63 antigen n=1 Tax=Rhizophlyctis rosea TaxID=64517 RepID=A0AAD5X1T5_9FUNG|nr:cd63 antigen [Rhizophlyctis rosea]
MPSEATAFSASRWTVFTITLLTGIAGLTTLALGIHAFIWPLGEALLPSALPTLVIILGALVFCASFLGAVGAVTEEKHVLKTYFAIGLALVIIQAVVAGVGLSGRGHIRGELEKSWNDNWQKHPAAIRNAEETYECCGFHNVTDRAYPKGFLDSCVINPDFAYTRSCEDVLVEEFRDRQYYLGVGGLVLAILQGASLIPTYYMFHRLDHPEGTAGERSRLLPN